MIGTGHRHHPRPLLRVAVLGDLVEVFVGEETGVGHQALVHRAELVDTELGVRDEPAVGPLTALGFLGQQQVLQNPLSRLVAEPDLVDQCGGNGCE